MKQACIALYGLLLSTTSAYAQESGALWFELGEQDETYVKDLTACLKQNAAELCRNIMPKCDDLANWGQCSYRATGSWSVIGQQLYEKQIKDHPKQANSLKKAQLAWYSYVESQCDFETTTATYSDDDTDGYHIPYFDRVTRSSCTYGLTMMRVIDLSRI